MRFIKGRLLGLILGFLLASVPGAVVGFILGYFWCDKPQAQRYRMEQAAANFNSLSGNANRELIIHTFTLMGYVARGAGAINQEHISKARELMDQMGLHDEAARSEAIAAFNEGKSDHFNFDEVMGVLRRYVAQNEMIGAYILEIQIMIAISDAILTDEEYRRLAQIARALGQSEVSLRNNINLRLAQMQFRQRYQQSPGSQGGYSRSGRQEQHDYAGQQQSRQQQYRYYERRQSHERNAGSEQARDERSKLQDAYNALGIDATATPEEIKKAHKRLMLKYHPDRLASQGLPPEMIRLYTEKAQDIQAAFDLIKKTRGFS